jgi:hypothetical protein
MNRSFITPLWLCAGLLLHPASPARAAEPEPPGTPIFTDKKLESAVRKFVFDKRDNDKPIVEADVVNLSTIQGVGLGITNLDGIEKCISLASLDLSKNTITDLRPLRGLSRIQYLNLADNQVEDIAPLAEIKALQYIELSRNRVKRIDTLAGLTNLASLYLSANHLTDIQPIVRLPKLASLYLDRNRLQGIDGIGRLHTLTSLSLSDNRISDIAPLDGLNGLFFLFLENNRIRDLEPLVNMAKNDRDLRFAPYLKLYVKGNPLSSRARKSQLGALEEIGVKVHR